MLEGREEGRGRREEGYSLSASRLTGRDPFGGDSNIKSLPAVGSYCLSGASEKFFSMLLPSNKKP
jgi:hypothetical protein